MHIRKFKSFSRMITEQVETSDDSGLIVVYDESVDGGSRDLAEAFMEELESKAGSPEAKAAVSELESKGASQLSSWQQAWETRKPLDEGELRKEGGWYFGKGAWRLNSNKALKIGMKPDWMEWNDPMHSEIIENFFPELLNGGQDVDAQSDDLDDVGLSDLGLDLPAGIETERELATIGESKQLKYIKRIFEQDEFTLGPGSPGAKVVTPDMLVKKLKMNFNMSNRYNLMIWGAPGIGKTQIVKQAAREIAQEGGLQSLPTMIVTLAQKMPVDLGGVPLLFDAAKGGEGSAQMVLPSKMKGQVQQDFTIPAWLPGENDAEQGILFFDEINRADEDMLAACLTLLLDREAAGGRYKMPSGWRIWAAGNREMDGPVKSLELAVASRFLGGHLHLVPTVESWIDWARSDEGISLDVDKQPVQIDGTNQWFVPDEFIAYLKHAESGEGDLKHFDSKGKGIKTDFKRFYAFDKAKLTATGEGVSVGVATPRNWAAAWNQIYDVFLRQPKYQDQITDDMYDDPRAKGIAAFALLLQDSEDTYEAQDILWQIVGEENAQDFFSYVKVLRRHSDQNGTINEKIQNIFKGNGKARPLLGIPRVNVSEVDAILNLVLSTIEGMKSTMSAKEYINWADWCVELVKENKVDSGEIASHVKQVNTSSNEVKTLATKIFTAIAQYKQTGKEQFKKLALAIKPFQEMFKDVLGGFNI
jgi:hypothetical protein